MSLRNIIRDLAIVLFMAALVMQAARWFHPALFTSNVVVVFLLSSLIIGAFAAISYERD